MIFELFLCNKNQMKFFDFIIRVLLKAFIEKLEL